MILGHSRRNDLSSSSSSSSEMRAPAPGKRTLTMGLPRTRAPEAEAKPGSVAPEEAEPAGTVDAWMASAMRPDLFLEDEALPIQRKASGEPARRAAAPAPSGSGQPLPAALQAKMSRSFGTDFSAVRVHEGPEAPAMGALAYTQGTDLFFAPGQYDPHSEQGQELIGHELAHSVQQSQGRVQATAQAKGQAINADPSLEREADEMGARAARGESARGGAAAPSSTRPHWSRRSGDAGGPRMADISPYYSRCRRAGIRIAPGRQHDGGLRIRSCFVPYRPADA